MRNALLNRPHCRRENCLGRYEPMKGGHRCSRCEDAVDDTFKPVEVADELIKQLRLAADVFHPAGQAADELSARRSQVSELRADLEVAVRNVDRLELCVGWLANVSAATAYSLACIKSTSKGERERQISIIEKTIEMLEGGYPPNCNSQDGVGARCRRTIAELAATLNTIRKDG